MIARLGNLEYSMDLKIDETQKLYNINNNNNSIINTFQ